MAPEEWSRAFCKHVFFIYDGASQTLSPVKNPDPITLDRLYLVDRQKKWQ